jgi:hypothetical protein
MKAKKAAAEKAAAQAKARAEAEQAEKEQKAKRTAFDAATQLRQVQVGDSKRVSRAIIRNPRRSDLRKTARMGGSTQFEVPTVGVSGGRR